MNKLIFATLFSCLVSLSSIAGDARMSTPSDKDQKTIRDNMSKIPVSFRKNAGQWESNILYRGFSPGWNANVNFLKNGLSFGIRKENEENEEAEKIALNQPKEQAEIGKPHKSRYDSEEEDAELLIWNLYFKGMNSDATLVAEGEQGSYFNYITGNDPSKNIINIPDYRVLTYTNVYNHIDIKYYSTGKNVKYDCIVKAGGNISDIQMTWDGIESIRVNENKQLEIKNKFGTLVEEMPESYQMINGQKVQVQIEYVALNKTTFGFKAVGKYDKSQTLIIDPIILAWGTWVGCIGTDEGYSHAVAVDPMGNVYSTGWYAANFPTTPGAYGTTYKFQQDAFVFKLSRNGSQLVYGTYLAGNASEWGYGVSANAAGECYIVGRTASNNFPTTAGAYQTTHAGGGFDIFVTKLNSTGTAAIYSTLIGGPSNDEGYDLAVNAAGEVYLTGVTGSGFPVTPGAFMSAYPTTTFGAFCTKINASGTALIYSTVLGGSSGNYGYGIDINAAGEAYVTGETGSWQNNPPSYTNFPLTPGAYKTTYGNCGWKGFITRFNASGTGVIYSSLIGGNGNCPQTGADCGIDVVVNAANEAYIIGNTGSASFPMPTNGYDKTFNGQYDGFLLKLNAAGTTALYATFVGGAQGENMCGIAVNSQGEAFVTGYTETDDGSFPVTSCAYQSVFAGQSTSTTGRGDLFIQKYNTTGTSLLYSTFMGGSSDDYKYPKVALFGSCEEEVIVNGTSHSSNFVTTPGSYMQAKGNGGDDQLVVFKLKPKVNPWFIYNNPNCNLTVNFQDSTYGVCVWQAGNWTPGTWYWDFGDGTTSTQQNPTHIYANAGTYQVKLVVTCPKDSIILPVTVTAPGSIASIPSPPPICAGGNAVLTAGGGTTYTWNTGATTPSITVTPVVTTNYTVVIGIGACTATATTSVIVSPSPTVVVGSNSPVCINNTLNLTSSGGTTYTWSGPNSFTSTAQNPNLNNVTPAASGIYTVTVTNAGGCTGTGTVSVIVNPAFAVVYKADTVCMGSPTTFTDLTPGVAPGTPYTWNFGDGSPNATQATTTTHTYGSSGTFTTTLSMGISSTCINSGTLAVTVKALPIVDPVTDMNFCPGQTTLPVNFTSTPGGSSSTFFWANTNTAIGLGAGGSGNLPSFVTQNSTGGPISGIVLVHAAFNGCTGPDSMFTINVNPNPIADFLAQNHICQGSAMQFVDHSNGNVLQWNWDLDNNGSFTDATTQTTSYTFHAPGTHTVSLIASINAACKDTVRKIVYVNPAPQPMFGNPATGCPTLAVKFTDLSTVPAPSQIAGWSWDFGNGATHNGQFPGTVTYGNSSPTQNATYTVSLTVTSDSGCSASITKPNVVIVYPRPIADFNYAYNSADNDGLDPTVHFYNASIGGSSIHWDLGDVFVNPASLNYTSVTNPVHTYMHEEGHVYYVTQWVMNSYGCEDSITKPIEIKPGFTFYIPNAFSPNGDGGNDGFKGTGIGIDNNTYNLMVFDRWGQMVFRSDDLEETWNGTFRGETVQQDVYVWKVDFKDFSGKRHEYKGTVTVTR